MIQKQFFLALSYLFHPILMPLYGLYFLFMVETKPTTFYTLDALYYFPDEAKKKLMVIIGILTFAAPLLSLLIMYYNKIIKSLHMESQSERTYPFILIIFYYLLAYFFVRMKVPVEMQHPGLLGFLFGMIVVFLFCFITNFYTKVSLHAAGIFGLSGVLLGYSQTQLPPDLDGSTTNLIAILYLIVVSGIVAGGRLYLKAHTLKEIVLGTTIGFLTMFICVRFGIAI